MELERTDSICKTAVIIQIAKLVVSLPQLVLVSLPLLVPTNLTVALYHFALRTAVGCALILI